MIHVAGVTDEALAQLVCVHRDNAGCAERIVGSGVKARTANVEQYRRTQNGWADLFQELLDRRREGTSCGTGPPA